MLVTSKMKIKGDSEFHILLQVEELQICELSQLEVKTRLKTMFFDFKAMGKKDMVG